MGPIITRPTHKRFERWKSFCGKAGAELLPLDEIEPGNPDDVAEVHDAMAMLPELIHMYLAEIVFPKATEHKPAKLSASGVDIGGGTIFGSCFGFSGTPSAMLPTKVRNAKRLYFFSFTFTFSFPPHEISLSVSSPFLLVRTYVDAKFNRIRAGYDGERK